MCSYQANGEDIFLRRREAMIEQQLKSRGIKDPDVLNAMGKVDRHLFVDPAYLEEAYADKPLPIGYDQTISQPYIVAYMTEAVRLGKENKVLEIGTGSGYQSAILGEIAQQVYTIEIVAPLAESAKERLERLGYTNIHVKHGDGYEGWEEYSPYDAIIVTAAPQNIPQKLVEQLKIGGRMVIPVEKGEGETDQELKLVIKTEEGIRIKALLPVKFVPMVHDTK